MAGELDKYRNKDGEYVCPGCEAKYEEFETFKLHHEYCEGKD